MKKLLFSILVLLIVPVLVLAGQTERDFDTGTVVWPQYYNGTNFKHPRIDASTKTIMVISYAHHEIHAGSSYEAIYNQTNVDSGETLAVTFQTPTGSALCHVWAEVIASAESGVSLFESPTVLSNGTYVANYNANRSSSNTSGTTIRYNAGVQAATGTNLWPHIVIGSSSNKGTVGGGTRALNEKVLASGTTYVYIVESRQADNEITVWLHWYQHTDRDP